MNKRDEKKKNMTEYSENNNKRIWKKSWAVQKISQRIKWMTRISTWNHLKMSVIKQNGKGKWENKAKRNENVCLFSSNDSFSFPLFSLVRLIVFSSRFHLVCRLIKRCHQQWRLHQQLSRDRIGRRSNELHFHLPSKTNNGKKREN